MVGRTDQIEDKVRGQALFVLQESADGFAIGVGAETVVMRRRQRQRRAVRGGLASFRVVREQSVVECSPSERAAFGDERRASARCQWGLLTKVDDAAERVGAVESGGGATQDFDGGQSEDAVAADLVGVGETLRKTSPIEKDGCLGGISTAEEDRADRTFAGLLRGEDTGGAASRLVRVVCPASVAAATSRRLTEGEASAKGFACRVSITTVSGSRVGAWARRRAAMVNIMYLRIWI